MFSGTTDAFETVFATVSGRACPESIGTTAFLRTCCTVEPNSRLKLNLKIKCKKPKAKPKGKKEISNAFTRWLCGFY